MQRLQARGRREVRRIESRNVRLQKEYKDAGQYANPATWPKGGVDGPFDAYQPLGIKTETEAIALSTMK